MPLNTVGMLNFTPVALAMPAVKVSLVFVDCPAMVQLLLKICEAVPVADGVYTPRVHRCSLAGRRCSK